MNPVEFGRILRFVDIGMLCVIITMYVNVLHSFSSSSCICILLSASCNNVCCQSEIKVLDLVHIGGSFSFFVS